MKTNIFNLEDFEKHLQSILESKCKKIVAINGEWGTGKSYFMKNYINMHTEDICIHYDNLCVFGKSFAKTLCHLICDICAWIFCCENEKLKHKTYIYISLFGKESHREILEEIALKIHKNKFFFMKIIKFINKLLLPKADADILFSLLVKKDFKDMVVCFDDLERMSSRFNFNEFLGLISELKERKQCNVVLILNKNKLENKCKIFNRYNEKCIDLYLDFKPDIKGLFQIAKKEISINSSFNEDKILQEFEKVRLSNLRIMFYILEALNEFAEFFKTNKDINKDEALENTIKALLIHKLFSIISELEQGKHGENEKIDVLSTTHKDKMDIFENYIKDFCKNDILEPKEENSLVSKYLEYFIENPVKLKYLLAVHEYYKASYLSQNTKKEFTCIK